MMTLQLKRCVSLFVCLSLLVSACSPDKSSKAGSNKTGSAVDMARNQSNIQGLVTQHKNTDTSAGNNRPIWYPTWYTLTTEAVVGVATAELWRRAESKQGTKDVLLYYGTSVSPMLVAGEAARAVTTGFELGPVAGAGAGVLTGAVAGGLTGATVFATLKGILYGKFDGLETTIVGALGAIFGGITGLATGLESARWSKPDKSTTPKSTTKPDEDKQKQEEQKQGEQKKQ
ncbi:MAG: hypothetical protein LE178_05885, partial [Endomicrobium sp.]|nr:hypothetical protein [Endomicrobium sp.]